jgi:hypothetical protein
MKKTFILLFDSGPKWDESKEIEQQDYWENTLNLLINYLRKVKL